MNKLIILILACSLCAMEREGMTSSQRYGIEHSSVPRTTLRKYIEENTGFTCEEFLKKATNPNFGMYLLFCFFQDNPTLLDQYIFPMIVENLGNVRWYLFGQTTPPTEKKNPLIIEETAQTLLGIINSFKPH